MAHPIRILHAHSTFSLGGKEARAVRLMNAWGDNAEHVVLSAVPGALSAKNAIDAQVKVELPKDAPPLAGRPSPRRLLRLSRFARFFDLVLTYNWGAFDMVMARRLFGGPPLVHHEDGFNEDEASGLKRSRNLYRRLGMAAAHRLVVPSHRLERIAFTAWAQPRARVARIANGIAVDRYQTGSERIPGVEKRAGEVLIGTVAGLRAVKNLPRLVRALGMMERKDCRLVIVGEGPESDRIMAQARALGLADRVLLPGFVAEPWRWIGSLDIFALSSDSEQFPISLVEAMAAGLPAVCTDVGDVGSMVSDDNRPLIVSPDDERGLAAALDSLVTRADLRRAIGRANQAKAVAEYGERAMIAAYAHLYGEAIGRPNAFIVPPT